MQPRLNPLDQQELLEKIAGARVIVFDFNGTLADDVAALEYAYGQALEDLGLPALTATDYAELLGTSEPEIAAELVRCRGADPSLAQALLERASARYVETSIVTPRLSPRVVDFLHSLHRQGKKLAVVTGTVPEMISPVLEERGLSALIDLLVTIRDVSRSKPDPEGFLSAAQHFAVGPGQALVFEDSPGGVAAAQAARMPVIGVGDRSGVDLSFPTMHYIAETYLSERGRAI